jgi:fucose 4-O-acetylase-like acetyltransferase
MYKNIFKVGEKMANHQEKRNGWLDIAKGIAIILVVVGHSASFDVSPIYWFHMPAFFIISGFLYKPLSNRNDIKGWLIKRGKQLLIPYLFFLLLITFIRYTVLFYQSEISLTGWAEDFIGLIIGGRFFPSDFYVVMWFTTCMFFTQMIFAIIHTYFQSNTLRYTIIAILYWLAHIETWYAADHNIFVPWNIDVGMLAIAYYAFGYGLKSVLSKFKSAIHSLSLTIVSVLAALIFVLSITIPGAFIFDMRSITYNHPVLDLTIPISLTILLLIASRLLATLFIRLAGILAKIGQSSLIIMYTHVPIKLLYEGILETNNLMIVMLGITLPLLISRFILEKNPHLNFIVLGRLNSLSVRN